MYTKLIICVFGIVSLIATLPVVYSFVHDFHFYNYCTFPIWVGISNNYGSSMFADGGFKMEEESSNSSGVSVGWSGRIWARTNCGSNGHCETGDCGGVIGCANQNAGPVGPTTVAQISFNSLYQKDYYEVSLVDGFNVPIQIAPVYPKSDGDYYHCTRAGCKSNLNTHCPSDLAVHNSAGTVIACKSPCQAFGTDQYCCKGKFNQADRCKNSDWPTSYSTMFKNACPDARNYVYDTSVNVFSCGGVINNVDYRVSDYQINFCPK